MVDEVDRQIQIKQQLDKHNAGLGDLSDLDKDTTFGKKKPQKGNAAAENSKSQAEEEAAVDAAAHKLKEKLDRIREENVSLSEKLTHAKEAVSEISEEVHIKKKIYRYEAAIAGAGAGSCARICTQPLDVLKIRFQLQVERISDHDPRSKYQGLFHATRQIMREEKVWAFWKGHSTAQFLSTSYGMLQVVTYTQWVTYEWLTYEVLTKEAWNYSPTYRSDGVQPFLHFVCGGVAGCVGTLASSPFDVIRTRLVGQGKPEIYRGTWHAGYLMLRDEGITTFYKGMVPALLQIAPYSGMQFMAYSMLTKHWKKKKEGLEKKEESGWLTSLLCGMMAGLIAKSVIYPLDVVKKRLQVQGFHTARQQFGKTVKYKGLLDCFRVMMRDEGPYSIYKGYIPSCLKAATNTGLNFMMYEQFITFLHFVESDSFWFDF
uniref:Mitochondrial thiamine pyrophosphate carrier n=1 Tax=Strigamia maritima TaxID=126957 RepID=T1IVW8_STRMM